MTWRIYYEHTMVQGRTEADWKRAPDDGVQVIVLMEPPERPQWRCEAGVVRDRQLWTGEDSYDPFGWGAKYGSLIDDEAYFAIWERACGA